MLNIFLLLISLSVMSNEKGLTFVVNSEDFTTNSILMGCGYEPPQSRRKEHCNPYHGDYSCDKELPILCLKKDNLQTPNTSDHHIRVYWSASYFASSTPIKGKDIKSLNNANQICEQEFGKGFRMAEWHDGTSGGRYISGVNYLVTNAQNFWVYINNKPASCFN